MDHVLIVAGIGIAVVILYTVLRSWRAKPKDDDLEYGYDPALRDALNAMDPDFSRDDERRHR